MRKIISEAKRQVNISSIMNSLDTYEKMKMMLRDMMEDARGSMEESFTHAMYLLAVDKYAQCYSWLKTIEEIEKRDAK